VHDGESVWVPERVIVSPSCGVFVPTAAGPEVDEGEVIGHVESPGDAPVPVTAPFAGQLISMYAAHGERVSTHDRIAWMRAA
jgi:biotin carboxyl carrier protein